jgi:hypothetical protein
VLRDQIERLLAPGTAADELRHRNPTVLTHPLFEATVAFHPPRSVSEHRAQDRLPQRREVLDLLRAGVVTGEPEERHGARQEEKGVRYDDS